MDYINIVFPCPNLSGQLHCGHYLVYTLTDVIVRFYKAIGVHTRWVKGVDHAGIITQLLVSKNYGNLNPESFLDWTSKCFTNISGQISNWGISSDLVKYKNNQFYFNNLNPKVEPYFYTISPGWQTISTNMFAQLKNNGQIVKKLDIASIDIVNMSAISDIEINVKNIVSPLYYIEYKLEKGESIVIASTRPETIISDGAIMTNNNNLVGLNAINPITKELLPILYWSDMGKIPGVDGFKLTPLLDKIDWAIYKSHKEQAKIKLRPVLLHNHKLRRNYRKMLGALYLWDNIAKMNAIKILDTAGAIRSIDGSHIAAVPFVTRTDQKVFNTVLRGYFLHFSQAQKERVKTWLLDINIKPTRFKSLAIQYLEVFNEWCISRELVWGQSIPGSSGQVFDTWYNSALVPYAIYEITGILPSHLLTGQDILFFWVLKMLLMWSVNHDIPPFRYLYLLPAITDANNKKMSKSKGNVTDPQDLIDKYGPMAAKTGMLLMLGKGDTTKMLEQPFEEARAFYKKLNNILIFLNARARDTGEIPNDSLAFNNYIEYKVRIFIRRIQQKLDMLYLHNLANFIIDFYQRFISKSILPYMKKEDVYLDTQLVVTLEQIVYVLFHNQEYKLNHLNGTIMGDYVRKYHKIFFNH
jgi:valyl-tRNA synthetase